MKYAIVTGGTRGIGKQISVNLLKKGYFVFITYPFMETSVSEGEKDLKQYGDDFLLCRMDQSDAIQIKQFTEFIISKKINIDCIIANAGTTLKKSMEDITDKEWEDVFRVNFHSNFYILRDLNNILSKGASIIFIGSAMAIYPHGLSLAYGVSKAALHALAKNLVKEYADRKIRINVVAPGFVETEWQINKPIEIKNNIINKTAIHRFASVEEISSACMFLIDNDFMNGEILEINGGYSYK